MNFSEFRRRVRATEPLARDNPALYRRRVAMFAAGGYLYFPLVVVASTILAGLLAWLVWRFMDPPSQHGLIFFLAIGICYVVVLGAACRVLSFNLERDEEYPLAQGEAEPLFVLVEILRRKLGVKFPRKVLLVNDFNAGIRHMPRLGILGLSRSELILGLPLMEALTTDQFRTVLAHEFGHQVAGHGRMMGWVFRTRMMWERLRTARADGGTLDPIWGWFVGIYLPRFEAFSHLMCRAHEYEADALAGSRCGRRAAAQALAMIAVMAEVSAEEVVKPFFARAAREELPAGDFLFQIRRRMRAPLDLEDGVARLNRALLAHTGFSDTHPCLRDRLVALGVELDTPRAVRAFVEEMIESQGRPSAAEELLGGRRDHYEAMFSKIFRAGTTSMWREKHQEAKNAAKWLEEQEKKGSGNPPTLEEQWQRIRAKSVLNPESKRALLEEFVAGHPDHPQACHELGREMIECHDDRGIALMQKAMHARPELRPEGWKALNEYLFKIGRDTEAEKLLDELEEYSREVDLANAERARNPAAAEVEAPGLKPEELAAIRTVAANFKWIMRAHVFRRKLRHLPHLPQLVICLEVKHGFGDDAQAINQSILNGIQQQLQGRFKVLILGFSTRGLGKKLRAMPECVVYEPQGKTAKR